MANPDLCNLTPTEKKSLLGTTMAACLIINLRCHNKIERPRRASEWKREKRLPMRFKRGVCHGQTNPQPWCECFLRRSGRNDWALLTRPALQILSPLGNECHISFAFTHSQWLWNAGVRALHILLSLFLMQCWFLGETLLLATWASDLASPEGSDVWSKFGNFVSLVPLFVYF